MPEDYRIGLFEGVWQGIRDAYVDPETNGLDWEAIGDEYAPLIISTDNAYEVYELLREMVALLDDPYTGFFAPEDLGDPDEPVDPSYGGIGALVDTGAAGEGSEGLRITYVFDGGSAKESGVQARDRVVAVNGDPCARVADIRGPEGTSVTLTVVSPGQEPREVSLERRRIEPLILPEARRLEAAPGVGYLRVISLSGEEAIDGIEQALTRFVRDEPLEGLVIDLRGSNQGAPGVILEALRPFVSGDVGAFHSRSGTEPIEIEPSDLADDYADVPVVVLVDEATEADAEQLAANLQDQGRASVVGTQTSGQTHGAQTIDFADGSLLQVVTFGFQLPDGRTLEGQGVTPDVEVTADWLDYPEAEDPGILAALEVIESPPASESAPAGPSSAERPSAAPSAAPPEPEPSPTPAG
jgi:carboxyl-terminal processing protease